MPLTGDRVSLRFFLVSLNSDPSHLLGETRFLEQWRWDFALVRNSFLTSKWHRTQKMRLKLTMGWGSRSCETAKVGVSLIPRLREREGVAG
jgi:hypothetical protein